MKWNIHWPTAMITMSLLGLYGLLSIMEKEIPHWLLLATAAIGTTWVAYMKEMVSKSDSKLNSKDAD